MPKYDNQNFADMKRRLLFPVMTLVALASASLMFSCAKNNEITEEVVKPDPFPIKVTPASLDTIMPTSEELNFKFKIKCYDVDKLEMNSSGTADYMHAQFTLDRRDTTLSIWSQRRVGNEGKCSVRLYDDQSEVTVRITVRAPR